MTIGGALSDLNNLLNADDIPFYYKPTIKAVMNTIALGSFEIPTGSITKNDLAVDCINKAEFVQKLENETMGLQSWQKALLYQVMDDCHSVTPQEPFKPMVEIDLYSVIKQKYIERDVLDKIRAEMESRREEVSKKHSENDDSLQVYYFGLNDGLKDARDILDKYKAGSEDKG
jgi:hypothetical protein